MEQIGAYYKEANGNTKSFIIRYYCTYEKQCPHRCNSFCSKFCTFIKHEKFEGCTKRSASYYSFESASKKEIEQYNIKFKNPIIFIVDNTVHLKDIKSEDAKNIIKSKVSTWKEDYLYGFHCSINIDDFTYDIVDCIASAIKNKLGYYNKQDGNDFLISLLSVFPAYFKKIMLSYHFEEIQLKTSWKYIQDGMKSVFKIQSKYSERKSIKTSVVFSKFENTCTVQVFNLLHSEIKGSNFFITYTPNDNDVFIVENEDEIFEIVKGNPFVIERD